MERTKLEDELNLCGVKRVNLGKAFDKIHSQASELLVFTVQWRDLEDYLKSVQGSIEKRFLELESREADLRNRGFAIDTVCELEVKADGLSREIKDKEEVLKMLVEECVVKERLKESQFGEMMESLRKTQAELAQKETDLERCRVEVSEEMERLGKAQTLRRELDVEVERKTRDLTLVQDKVLECGELLETRSLELRKTQGELDLKVEQLGHVKIEFERHHSELTTEMEHLERIQTHNRGLEEDIERKRNDLEVVEEQLDSQKKLLQTRSSELVFKEKELHEIRLDLDLREQMVKSLNNDMEEICQKMEHKAKELENIEKMINERSGHYESIKLLIEKQTEELASKEKRHNEITEAIHKLSLDLAFKEKSLEGARVAESIKKELWSVKDTHRKCLQNLEIKEKELKTLKSTLAERDKQVEEGEKKIQHLSNSNTELIRQLKVRQEQVSSVTDSESKKKDCDKVQRSIDDLIAEKDSVSKMVRSVKDAFRQCRQNLKNKEKELVSLESIITKRNKQAEEGEKKIQDLKNSNEELVRQVKVRQEQVCSVNKAIRECTMELEAKRKHYDKVQRLVTDLTVELRLKECHLSSVKKKIQESLEDLQSIEEQQVRLKASLMEHEHVALAPGDVHKPTGNSRKRGRYDDKSLSQFRDHMLTNSTILQENTYNFEKQRSLNKFKVDQIWAIYSDSDKGMPRKYAQIKRIDTSPEFKLHVAPLVLYRPPPNLTAHTVSCGRFKLKTGKAEVLRPSSFSHEVKAVKSSVNRFEVYPRKGEIWALYKNWNIRDCADGSEEEELEIVEVVETNEESIQAMLLTAKVFNKFLYGRCLESMAGFVEISKKEVNRFSHQVPAFRRDRSATRFGDCEWWELDSKAVLDL